MPQTEKSEREGLTDVDPTLVKWGYNNFSQDEKISKQALCWFDVLGLDRKI